MPKGIIITDNLDHRLLELGSGDCYFNTIENKLYYIGHDNHGRFRFYVSRDDKNEYLKYMNIIKRTNRKEILNEFLRRS